MPEDLRELIPNLRCGKPDTEDEIRAVESQLQVQIPQELRKMYSLFDGFREPIGNAAYLLPLTTDHGAGSVVSENEYLRSVKDELHFDPAEYLFYGSSCEDKLWGMALNGTGQIIAYKQNMEGAYESVGTDVIDTYLADLRKYDA